MFPPNSSFINPIIFLFFPLGNGLSNSKFEVSSFSNFVYNYISIGFSYNTYHITSIKICKSYQYFNCKYLFNYNNYNNKDFITNGNDIAFISNNVKWIQGSQKRIKLFEYLKSYVTSNGFVFLRKHIRQLMMQKMKYEKMNSVSFFSLTEKQIHAQFWLAFMEPKR